LRHAAIIELSHAVDFTRRELRSRDIASAESIHLKLLKNQSKDSAESFSGSTEVSVLVVFAGRNPGAKPLVISNPELPPFPFPRTPVLYYPDLSLGHLSRRDFGTAILTGVGTGLNINHLAVSPVH
jgi:hypothetical protein